jgi:hypothetical protein
MQSVRNRSLFLILIAAVLCGCRNAAPQDERTHRSHVRSAQVEKSIDFGATWTPVDQAGSASGIAFSQSTDVSPDRVLGVIVHEGAPGETWYGASERSISPNFHEMLNSSIGTGRIVTVAWSEEGVLLSSSSR